MNTQKRDTRIRKCVTKSQIGNGVTVRRIGVEAVTALRYERR